MAGAFMSATDTGPATASAPAPASSNFLPQLNFAQFPFAIISSIPFFRFARVTPATRGGLDTCLLGIDGDFECVALLDEAVSAVGILLLVNHF